jgi:hypothetical protein
LKEKEKEKSITYTVYDRNEKVDDPSLITKKKKKSVSTWYNHTDNEEKPLIITFEQDADHNNLFQGVFMSNYDYLIGDVSLWIPSIIK